MTKRALRDWWIFICGALLSCFGLAAPFGAVFIIAGLALRAEDWMRSREVLIHIRKRQR